VARPVPGRRVSAFNASRAGIPARRQNEDRADATCGVTVSSFVISLGDYSMHNLQCNICKMVYPSEYYFKCEGVCIGCYERMSPEEKRKLSDAIPVVMTVPAATGPVEGKKRRLGYRKTGALIGAGIGLIQLVLNYSLFYYVLEHEGAAFVKVLLERLFFPGIIGHILTGGVIASRYFEDTFFRAGTLMSSALEIIVYVIYGTFFGWYYEKRKNRGKLVWIMIALLLAPGVVAAGIVLYVGITTGH
jgi:hypothetical protein